MEESRQAVQDGKIVALRYTLRNQLNEIIEDIMDLPSVRYRHGSSGIQQSLQKAISGLYAGDELSIKLSPETSPELDQSFLVTVIIDEVSDADNYQQASGPIANQFSPVICDADCDCFCQTGPMNSDCKR